MKINKIILAALLILLMGCASTTPEVILVTELSYPTDLAVFTRAQWKSQPLEKALPEHEIFTITIHHGGVVFSEDEDPVQHLQKLQAWSRSDEKNWIDIPYHFMLDLEGKIYETRPINYPGATNTTYDPTGHALICVMGNYEEQIISEEQLDALVNLCTYLAKLYNVDPATIKGHKDYTETLCPGRDLYRYIEDGTIEKRVREQLSSTD